MSIFKKIQNWIVGFWCGNEINFRLLPPITFPERRKAVNDQIYNIETRDDLDAAYDAIYQFKREFKWDKRVKRTAARMTQNIKEKELMILHSKVQ